MMKALLMSSWSKYHCCWTTMDTSTLTVVNLAKSENVLMKYIVVRVAYKSMWLFMEGMFLLDFMG